MFGRKNEIPIDVGIFLINLFEETWRVMGDDVTATVRLVQLRQQAYIRWKAPPLSWLALNTDGAARGAPGPTGGGGILRDQTGKLLYAFTANFGSCIAFRAELKALEIGLELALRMRVSKLMVQMDNQAAIQALNSSENYG